MSEIQYDPACVSCRIDAGKDVAGTTWQCHPHVHAERDRLRLALETAEANEEKLHETNERIALDLVDAEDDRADLAEMYEATAAERDALLSRPAPPADAATEAVEIVRNILTAHDAYITPRGTLSYSTPVASTGFIAAIRWLERVAPTPAPAPSTDPWRACGCADPDNCEHIFRAPAPSAPAMRRCEQPEVKK